MCGIAGWVGSRIDKSNIAEMLDAISHRGPDGTGYKSLPVSDDCEAVFGHVRLSILDIESGAQPMVSHCGRFTITYNGEVYNYIELREELEGLGATFRTNSDTEVILASWVQWGEKCLERFRSHRIPAKTYTRSHQVPDGKWHQAFPQYYFYLFWNRPSPLSHT